MIEVHPPNEPVHSWRDFFVHLATITIGLMIALSLEGCVEWIHHKHLVHAAQASLQVEIEANAKELQKALDDVSAEQKQLAEDVAILEKMIAKPKLPDPGAPKILFELPTFNDVSWETAKNTGALSYMPYEEAHQYSDIYKQQDEVDVAEHQAASDAVLSFAPMVNREHISPKVRPEDAPMVKQRIEVLQARLYVLESLIHNLGEKYKTFLLVHPE